MKNKLGYLATASYGKTKELPKGYFKEMSENRTNSKYIAFSKKLELGGWFKATGYLPEFILWQEQPITEPKDLKATGSVNVFLREKINENVVKFQAKYLQPVETLDW